MFKKNKLKKEEKYEFLNGVFTLPKPTENNLNCKTPCN